MESALSTPFPPPSVCPTGQLSGNSRHGVRSWNPAQHPWHFVCNSRTAIGLQFGWSGIVSGTVVAPNNGISDAKWNCEQNVIMGSLVHGAASALGVDGPPGSDPAGDLASTIRDAARNPVVQLSAGVIAVQMGRILATPAVAARIGVLVADEAVPIIGWGATAYIGYQAVSAGVSYFNSHIGSCSAL